tara:strand:- start:330 stop:479 length:150 start_codon:yes stop_codon:yes gene_type:complete
MNNNTEGINQWLAFVTFADFQRNYAYVKKLPRNSNEQLYQQIEEDMAKW